MKKNSTPFIPKTNTIRFIILSPDGFALYPDKEYECEESKVESLCIDEVNKWKQRYVPQGYYSSTDHGRIHLEDILEYCDIEILK